MRQRVLWSAALCTGLVPWPAAPAQCSVVPVPGLPGARPVQIAAAFGQQLYFVTKAPATGVEPYLWDAAGGARLLADINGGTANSNPSSFTPCCTALGPRVFFAAFKAGSGSELWVTDGTAAGTRMVADIRPGSSSSNPEDLFAMDGRVFFCADDGSSGNELWVTDGTAAGTARLGDLNPGPSSSHPTAFASRKGVLYFTAFETSTGREPWVSDGTAAGTLRLGDIGPGAGSSGTFVLVPCGDTVFFDANDGTWGAELWKTDGTPAGTVMVADLNQSSSPSTPLQLCCCGDTLFFTAIGAVGGRELYRSDGTAAGTVMVEDIRPGPASSGITSLTCAGDRVFFPAAPTGSIVALWVSDGTAAGTYEVPSPAQWPQLFVPAATGVCYRATGAGGAEVWFSDGTSGGTFEVCDLNPQGSGNPTQLLACAGRVFFTADDPATGNELFQIRTPGAMAALLGEGGLPDRPTLGTRAGAAPVLGTAIELVASGPPGHLGLLYLGPSGMPAPPIPPFMQGGCDWAAIFLGAPRIATTAQPSFALPLPIPATASLEGAAVNVQMAWIDLAATPILQLSNGVQLVLGPAAPH